MRVEFQSGPLRLEGDLAEIRWSARGAVICHPHPQYGGDMDNPVVLTATAALQRAGMSTLRFNFRGTGGSAGSYDRGVGEGEDAGAAVRYLIERTGARSVVLAGYSFGAMVALQAGPGIDEVDTLIAVAPPLAFFELGALAQCRKPKLFVVGDRDQFCDAGQLERAVGALPGPKMHRIVRGADHFFIGFEAEIAEAIEAFIRNPRLPVSLL